MTPLGLGNDLGGSLRIPAQMCGITAIKPSRGRVAEGAVTEPAVQPISIQMTMVAGPMARRVADSVVWLRFDQADDAERRDVDGRETQARPLRLIGPPSTAARAPVPWAGERRGPFPQGRH